MSIHRRRAIIGISKEPDFTDYFSITSNEDHSKFSLFTATDEGASKEPPEGAELPELEYSFDKKNWSPLLINETEVTLNNGEKVYIRGDNPNGLIINPSSSGTTYITFDMDGSFSADGNIQTLLDKSGQKNDVPRLGFACLFNQCEALIAAPKLPAIELEYKCYYHMFRNTSIVTCPDLPADTIPQGGYSAMFENCTNLTTVAKMNATLLKQDCCTAMYSGCTSLITLPKLMASSFGYDSLAWMFWRCSKISIRTVEDETHTIEYRIPFEGTGTSANEIRHMLYETQTGNPDTLNINTTYYTSNELI